MDSKICVDTDICIEILKNTEKGNEFLDIIEEKEVFISSITIFELFLREENFHPIEKLIFESNVLDFSEVCARKASDISKELKRNGKMTEIRDLFIASIAIVNNCTLASLNKKHYENIKGLKLLEI